MRDDPSPPHAALDLRTVAVVLAGGSGGRLGLDAPKQLIKIAGRTILEHTDNRRRDLERTAPVNV